MLYTLGCVWIVKKNILKKTKHPIDVSLGREHRSFSAEGGKA